MVGATDIAGKPVGGQRQIEVPGEFLRDAGVEISAEAFEFGVVGLGVDAVLAPAEVAVEHEGCLVSDLPLDEGGEGE